MTTGNSIRLPLHAIFLRPWNDLPALMGSAPPRTPTSTGTGVVTFLMGWLRMDRDRLEQDERPRRVRRGGSRGEGGEPAPLAGAGLVVCLMGEVVGEEIGGMANAPDMRL
jgi:hypothetical protein